MKVIKYQIMKLASRCALFIVLVLMLLKEKSLLGTPGRPYLQHGVLPVIWLIYMVEIAFRFFPFRHESIGCQKQFAQNYRPAKQSASFANDSQWPYVLIILLWLLFFFSAALLYKAKLLGTSALILISVFLSICDVLFILFYCPLQHWFMKNKCCVTCRIYNWDYLMIFSPLLLIRSFFTWSICSAALLLLIRWEFAYRRHPERFNPDSNARLRCNQCSEKLCRYKKAFSSHMLFNPPSTKPPYESPSAYDPPA